MLNSPKVLALRETLARAVPTLNTSHYLIADRALRDQVCGVVENLKALR